VLKRWGHTEQVIAVVRRHHAETPPAQNTAYWHQLVVAAQMARELTQEEDLTAAPPWPSPELLASCAESINLDEQQRAQLVAKLHDEYASALDALLT